MAEDYNPTRKEVLEEVVNRIKQPFNRDRLKAVGTKLKETGKYSIATIGFFSLCPYILPTTIHWIRDGKFFLYQETKHTACNVGLIIGAVTGIALDIAQTVGYLHALEYDHPEVLLIPVVTNAVSGICEAGRKVYNNAKQRISDRHKDLEGMV
tara:strand:- start:15356 stop:15814 length:459 start_codon:yes stop_codon:yes gene_type:complete